VVPFQSGSYRLDHPPYLAVDDDRVETLLAAEVLVHHGFGDLGSFRDVFDRGCLVSNRGENGSTDIEKLSAPLLPGHPDPSLLGMDCHLGSFT
jgi:hypothetical protein